MTETVPVLEIADALDCFWNAAIGAAHERQSSLAMDVASVMAEGIAAISTRLKERAAHRPNVDEAYANGDALPPGTIDLRATETDEALTWLDAQQSEGASKAASVIRAMRVAYRNQVVANACQPNVDEIERYVESIMHYGSRCRDCADSDGFCAGSRLPCDPDDERKAIRFVLEGYRYYREHPRFLAALNGSGNHG